MGSLRLRQLKEKIQLEGDENEHEQVDSWSNRDLIPLPPSRRTWGWFHFFGYWTLNSLNVSNWQTPNTFLCMFLLRYKCDIWLTLQGSLWTLRWSEYDGDCCWKASGHFLFHTHRLVWTQVAHRIHGTEPLHLGTPWKLHSTVTKNFAELHLVRNPM